MSRPNKYTRTFSRAPRLGFCTRCNKQTFSSRKAAKADMKSAFPGEQLNAFPCPFNTSDRGEWHYGHLQEGDRG